MLQGCCEREMAALSYKICFFTFLAIAALTEYQVRPFFRDVFLSAFLPSREPHVYNSTPLFLKFTAAPNWLQFLHHLRKLLRLLPHMLP